MCGPSFEELCIDHRNIPAVHHYLPLSPTSRSWHPRQAELGLLTASWVDTWQCHESAKSPSHSLPMRSLIIVWPFVVTTPLPRSWIKNFEGYTHQCYNVYTFWRVSWPVSWPSPMTLCWDSYLSAISPPPPPAAVKFSVTSSALEARTQNKQLMRRQSLQQGWTCAVEQSSITAQSCSHTAKNRSTFWRPYSKSPI